MKLIYPLAALCWLACNNKQPQQGTDNAQSRGDTLIAAWSVKGCAEAAKKADTKFPASGEFNDFPDMQVPGLDSIRVRGDSVIYQRYVHHGCCRKARVDTRREGQVITITEYWWGQICKCMCNSVVNAEITRLPKGTYQVFALETGTDPITDKPAEGRDTVMRKVVEIR